MNINNTYFYPEYSLNATNLLLINDFIFYVGNFDTFTSFQTDSCALDYIAENYKCVDCKKNCAVCNASYYCHSCATSNAVINYGSTYAQIYQSCGACSPNCYICSKTTRCKTCMPGYELNKYFTCSLIKKSSSLSSLAVIVNALTNITALTNFIPSARTILKPLLYVLISLDDFFPYMYHERFYGQTMESLFDSIHQTETDKWSTYD